MNSAPHNTSLTLIARAKDQQPAAWVRLVQLYGPLVYSWARAADLPPIQVAAVARDVFGQVRSELSTFELRQQPGAFRLWLSQITQEKLAKHRALPRADGNSSSTDTFPSGGPSCEPSCEPSGGPSVPADADARTLLISAAVRIVKAESESNTWDAFWRMTVHGESAVEIAGDLGISPRTVRSARFQVTRKLRQLLADDLEELSLFDLAAGP